MLLAISTPRLMGPGCMIKASGFTFAKRAVFRPNNAAYSPVLGNIEAFCRSCWIRSRLMTSASRSASSTFQVTRTFGANDSKLFGTKVGGPHNVTLAPSLVRAQMFDRATRL